MDITVDSKNKDTNRMDSVNAKNVVAPLTEAVQEVPRCRFCEKPLQQTVVDLGNVAAVRKLSERGQLNQMEPFYPLHVLRLRQLLPGATPGVCESGRYLYASTPISPRIPTAGSPMRRPTPNR